MNERIEDIVSDIKLALLLTKFLKSHQSNPEAVEATKRVAGAHLFGNYINCRNDGGYSL